MSAPTARRLVTAGSLSFALALAAPVAALADPGEQGERGSSTAEEQRAKGKPSPSPTASSASAGGAQGSSQSAGKGDQGKNNDGKSGEGKGNDGKGDKGKRGDADQRSSKGERDGSKGERDGSGQGRAAGGDPRGNNGTVKIDGLAFDDTPGNEPHVGCTFQVDFFGFDAGDTAQVTLTGHAPTGGGELYDARHTISDDAAGGGQDVDASITFTAQQLGLFSITPHPKQGWHVKLAADVDSAPGGAKQKVFWVRCAPPAVTGTSTSPATGGGTTAPGTGTTTTTVVPPAGGAGTGVISPRSVERSAPEQTFGSGTATLSGTTAQAATAGAGEATAVSARGAVRPSVLPFTGTEGLAYLLALGASAIGVGTVAHRLGRRRATV